MQKLNIHCGRWRNYDVIFVWLKLEQVYSTQYQDIIFLRVQSTCWCIDAVVPCIMWWNLRQFNIKQLFIHKPD